MKGQNLGTQKTERDRETDPISQGLSPLPRHGDHGPEGKPFSHLGRRSRKNKKKKGGSLPLTSGGARTPPGAIIITTIYTNTSAIFTNISTTFPPSIFSGPLSRNPLYPLLEHGALCFILLSNDVLPSYDV